KTNSFTQVTNTNTLPGKVVGAREPAINGDGTRIAFDSDQDLTGGNADGNQEIFLFDTKTNSFTQITNTTGLTTTGLGIGNFKPSIRSDGRRIAFQSSGFPAGNPDGNTEIFLFDTKTNSFTQITNTAGSSIVNQEPVISGDGTHIAFHSNGFPAGNPDGN